MRSGDADAIGGYLGSGTFFDKAIGEFAVAYADQIEQDYKLLVDAVNVARSSLKPAYDRKPTV